MSDDEKNEMDVMIAQRVRDLRLGRNENVHSWRAICLKVTGFEDQHTGMEICRNAAERLGEDWE